MKITKQISAFKFYQNKLKAKKEAKKNEKNQRLYQESSTSFSFLRSPKTIFTKSLDQFDSILPPSKKVRFLDEKVVHEFEKNDPSNKSLNVTEIETNRSPELPMVMKSKIYKKKSKPNEKNIRKIKSNLKRKLSDKSLQELKNAEYVKNLDFMRLPKIDVKTSPSFKKTEDDNKSDSRSFSIPPHLTDSREQAKKCFQWLIHPHDVDHFFRVYWEKEPMLIKRNQKDYYFGVFSTSYLDKILKERQLIFTKNIDLTIYDNDERKTHNPSGKAYPAVVWDYYQNGCSVRLLNPQTYSRSVWKLNSILQELFGTFVGANVYLTPPDSQGFAPHYDDIEAFVLQLEGKKHWKVYAPPDEGSTLPRFSSKNFKREELKNFNPLMNVELEAGDLLYFPRGFIHEAKTKGDTHSLHITISAYQRNTFGDFLKILLPEALESALENDLEFRESLPINYMHYMGVVHQEKVNADRVNFENKVKNLLYKLFDFVKLDAGVDQMAKKFIETSLPPALTNKEKNSSVHGSGEYWDTENNIIEGAIELEPDTQIKLIRYSVIRIVVEEGQVRLYHSLENSYDPNQEIEPNYVEIESDYAEAVEYLIKTYPNYVEIEQLPLETIEQKLDIANLLYDKGLVTIIQPDSGSESS